MQNATFRVQVTATGLHICMAVINGFGSLGVGLTSFEALQSAMAKNTGATLHA